MTVRLDGPDRAAEQWVVDHLPRDKRIIVDDEYWIYLIEHGYNARPMRGGFFSNTVVSYWPLDYDPAVKRTFPQGWRDFDYIVVTPAILDTLTNTPTAAAAIKHSRLVASFGQGPSTVQVRADYDDQPVTSGFLIRSSCDAVPGRAPRSAGRRVSGPRDDRHRGGASAADHAPIWP